MSELRRLLIDKKRLRLSFSLDGLISLKREEEHYLRNVIRLNKGNLIAVVDGEGDYWEAEIISKKSIRLKTNFDKPSNKRVPPSPSIGLAVSKPKKDFETILRMSTEIGVDIIQPLISSRSVVNSFNENKFMRWQGIVKEAVEQSERLWIPAINNSINVLEWLSSLNKNDACAFAHTRNHCYRYLPTWLSDLDTEISTVWIVIGPEGGWDSKEESFILKNGYEFISLGNSIMRTSTAAICATHFLVNWREESNFVKRFPNCSKD
tara:strand:+ start:3137 stop:3928 length:792 start_codon:yes stop_codon:yes gene_type:complete